MLSSGVVLVVWLFLEQGDPHDVGIKAKVIQVADRSRSSGVRNAV